MIRVITRLLEDIYVNHYINICRAKSKVLAYIYRRVYRRIDISHYDIQYLILSFFSPIRIYNVKKLLAITASK